MAVQPKSRLSLRQLFGHAWRVRSPRIALLAVIAATFNALGVRWWAQTAPWYAGKLVKAWKLRIPIDGLRFELPSSVNIVTAGFAWLGVYETNERYAVARFLPRSLPVVELGGSAGVVACLTNRLLTDPTRHTVVEANPYIVPILERNGRRNGCRFVTRHAALAYGGESVEFGVAKDFLDSSLDSTGDGQRVTVPATSLAKIVTEAGYERCSVVCDIEGAEMALLRNEGEVFRKVVEAVLLEVHPAMVGRDAMAWLEMQFGLLGFSPVWKYGDVWFLTKNRGTVV